MIYLFSNVVTWLEMDAQSFVADIRMYEIPSSLAEFLFHGQISTEKTVVKKSGVELEKQICEYTIL